MQGWVNRLVQKLPPHSPYELTCRYQKLPFKANDLHSIYKTSYDKYMSHLSKLTLYERIDLMEAVYAHPRLLQEFLFPKNILYPFTQGMSTIEVKQMNLRLSYLYYKWMRYMSVKTIDPIQRSWDQFFTDHSPYYLAKWRTEFTDYLLSLMYSYNALHQSKAHKDMIHEAGMRIIRDGLPPEIPRRSDAHRAIMKKTTHLVNCKNFPFVYRKLAIPYFEDLEGIEEGKLIAVTLELVNFFSSGMRRLVGDEAYKIIDNVNREIDRNIAVKPGYLNRLLSIIGYRINSQHQIPFARNLFMNKINSFRDLSTEGFIGYTRILCVSGSLNSFRDRDYLETLEFHLKDGKSRIELFNALAYAKINTSHLSPKISHLIANIKAELLSGASNVANKTWVLQQSLSQALDELNSSDDYNEPAIQKILAKLPTVEEKCYISITIEAALYFAARSKYENYDFWSKFIDCLKHEEKLAELSAKDAKYLYCTYLFLKEDGICNLEENISKEIFDRLKNRAKDGFAFTATNTIALIHKALLDLSIQSVTYSPDYWLLPIAIPELKVGLTIQNKKGWYPNKWISRLTTKHGWKIHIIEKIPFKELKDADMYVRKILSPYLHKKVPTASINNNAQQKK